MSKTIIVGNWKMNPETAEEAKKIFSGLKRISKNFKTKVVICAPFVFLSSLSNKGSNISLGAQNVFAEDQQNGSKAFTGEISAQMLKNLGIEYTIVGHSERRQMGETDELINKKIKALLKLNIRPVACVGEKERDEDGHFFEELRAQIKNTFAKLKKGDLEKIIIAYEPVWAIGKSDKENMKGEDLHQMTIYVRKTLAEMYGKQEAFKPEIIYGGSVSAANVEDIVSNGQVDGILPGRASLDTKVMKGILEILEKI